MKTPKTVRRPGLRIVLLASLARWSAGSSSPIALPPIWRRPRLRSPSSCARMSRCPRQRGGTKLAKRRSELKATSQPDPTARATTIRPLRRRRIASPQWSELAGKAPASGTAAPQASGAASGRPPEPQSPDVEAFRSGFCRRGQTLARAGARQRSSQCPRVAPARAVAPTEERARN